MIKSIMTKSENNQKAQYGKNGQELMNESPHFLSVLVLKTNHKILLAHITL